MKVLFAVSSESISEAIIKKYQKEYKEILSYKNVYYFNAILKEIQKDKTYDRIVISEDLEPFSNNNYDAIDKFIFEKLDNISDEAQDIDGNETSIILICTDRHTKGSSFLVKLFGIGIYNALLGSERSMEQVCRLINKPRVKKEAKMYYKIDAEDVNYSNKDEKEVSELEIQNILTHFKKLGKNTDKFADSFNSIASQYTDDQLKIIVNCLPINVKAVLEEDCPKYQELMSVDKLIQRVDKESLKSREAQRKTGIKIDIIENKAHQGKMSGPIVIPSSVRTAKNKGPESVRPTANSIETRKVNPEDARMRKVVKRVEPPQEINSTRPVKRPQMASLNQVMSNTNQNSNNGRKIENRIQKDQGNVSQSRIQGVRVQQGRMQDPQRLAQNRSTVAQNNRIQNTQKNVAQNRIGSLNNTVQNIKQVPKGNIPPTRKQESQVINNSGIPPVKISDIQSVEETNENGIVVQEKKGRGRPRKYPIEPPKPKGKRGRPRKKIEGEDDKLENLEDNFEENDILPGLTDDFEEIDQNIDDDVLPGLDDDFEEVDQDVDDDMLPSMGDEFTDDVDLPALDEFDDGGFNNDVEDELLPNIEVEDESDNSLLTDFYEEEEEPVIQNNYTSGSQELESIKPKVDYSMSSLNSLLTKDKKIVTFLGTTKNGTSFLVNNLAALFSSCGISTAILDMTKNKNSYYIYTNNEEELRNIAYNSISKLQKGFAEGIKANKNLSIYTALPNDGKDYSNAEPILSTLVQNHSLILIDCDFDTDPSYFASCQEIYLVQSMDILTIQPLTAFLRDLKAKGVLESEKVRVVINKELKVKSLTTKAIIGGMSFYNDPSMSFMTELFNKDMVKACSIPFEENAYSKYLDAMVNCNVSINGYSKFFLNKLKNLGDMVYPLVSKSTYGGKALPQQTNYGKSAFSKNMNNTLNQMKNKY